MFMGQYYHTIDAKGRLIIPSRFREVLGDEFVVSKGMDGCLYMYAYDDWNAFAQHLTSLPLVDKEAREFARYFLAGATSVEVDKQGRILIPANLRDFAGLDKDVVLAGVGSRVEIWSKESWDVSDSQVDIEQVTKGMKRLNLTV